MLKFIQLYRGLDETNSTNKKLKLLVEYFQNTNPSDAAWAIYFLSGNRFKNFITSRNIRKWAKEKLNFPDWLLSEIWEATGDSAEGIALSLDTIFPNETSSGIVHLSLTELIMKIKSFDQLSSSERKQAMFNFWDLLDYDGIFVLNKLLTGAFRVGVYKLTIANALAELSGIDTKVIQHRLMGIDKKEPSAELYQELINPETGTSDLSRPYPYFLASPLEDSFESLGDISEWSFEWKWDGIRAQILKRNDEVFLWSRGEELINKSFPEIISAADSLPNGTVLDGEIIAYHNNTPLAFSILQRRIGRENITSTILYEAPVIFMAYDIMELNGGDIRDMTFIKRRSQLEKLMEIRKEYPILKEKFKISQILKFKSWEDVISKKKEARDHQAEGFILKLKSSPYRSGRVRGDWWKSKIDPLTLDVVLIYAQSGSGKRANLFTAYTFAIWDEKQSLVPVGRAYTGLTNEQIKELDKWIRSNTLEKHGPVRVVKPKHVFELGFDGIMTNEKTKVGISLRFPRMLRWRKDLEIHQADNVEYARSLLKFEGVTEIKQYESLDEFF